MSRVEVTQETTPLSDGILKTDLPIDGTLQVVKDQLNNSSTLQISNTTTKVNSTLTVAERLNIESDSTVTTQTSSVISASTTNANLVIAPNGTGALVAAIPDGTTVGGNARGTNAVDLQTFGRTAATQVASGVVSFVFGARNTASSTFCIAMGDQSTASNQASIALGTTNTASGQYSVVSGGRGNTASSNFSTVSGGQSNTASTNTHATVVGGQSNTASGAHSTVIGGASNVASAQYAISGGFSNQATASFSFASGVGSVSYLQSQFSNASGGIAVVGDAQQSLLTARRELPLLTSGIAILSLDGTGVTNLIIPNGNNRAWNVQVNWVAVVTSISGTATGISVGDVITSIDLLAFKRVTGTSSVSSHTSAATKTMVTSPAQYVGCSIAYTAGASQQMALTFTGPTFAGGGSVIMRVVARIELSEVAW